MLVKEAGKFKSSIKIAGPKKEVDAKRIMSVMSLGVKQNDVVRLTIEGEDEDARLRRSSSSSRIICNRQGLNPPRVPFWSTGGVLPGKRKAGAGPPSALCRAYRTRKEGIRMKRMRIKPCGSAGTEVPRHGI